jgi:hypothetical protein
MRVKGTWVVYLPFTFLKGNSSKQTSLTNLEFQIHSLDCELLMKKDTNVIDRIKVIIEDEYDEQYLPSYEHMEYLTEFENNMQFKVCNAIQDFVDGFSNHTDYIYFRVFDGNSFTTKHEFRIEPNICNGDDDGNDFDNGLDFDDEALNGSIAFANKEKNYLDLAWYYLRDAEHFIDVGKYEIAIINMAIMLEFLINTKLKDYLDDKGSYKDQIHKDYIKNNYCNNGWPSFADKCYRYGLTIVDGKTFDEEILETIDIIYKTRDKIAHGKKLKDTPFMKTNKIKAKDYYTFSLNLKVDCDLIYNYFKKQII